MGFGLWENLDPTAPKKMKKRKPPPPPPKAEPIWYNCTVTVSETVNSHELDMLETQDIFTHMQSRLLTFVSSFLSNALFPETSGWRVVSATCPRTAASLGTCLIRRTCPTCSAEPC